MSFENFTILFSGIGPLLIIIFLIFIIPITKEFNSLTNRMEIDQFSIEYMAVLINLMYLLFTSYVFAAVGMMLGLVHKKIIIIIFDFLTFTIAFGMFFPTFIMILGGD